GDGRDDVPAAERPSSRRYRWARQPPPQGEQGGVDQEDEREPERARVEQRGSVAQHPPERLVATGRGCDEPYRCGPEEQGRHEPGHAEPTRPVADVAARSASADGTLGQQARDEEEEPDHEQTRRPDDRDE